MRVKSFYGATIREALERARRELGPDASLVAARQTTPGESQAGAYEVICSKAGSEASVETPPPPPPRPAPPDKSGREHAISRFRKSVDAWRNAVRLSGPDSFDDLRAPLLSDGFSPELSDEILAGVRQRNRALQKQTGAPGAADLLLRQELAERVSISAGLGRPRSERKVVALVGPPGAGKTATLVKLAIRYGLQAGRRTQFITLDGARVGGAYQLRTYAAGMATGIDVLETASGLRDVIEGHRDKSLILIDTPGYGPRDTAAAAAPASALSLLPEADVQLVLPATMSASDLSATISRFRPFLPSRLILTHVDAATSCRAAVTQAISYEKSISFLGTGQAVPEDLTEATVAALFGNLQTSSKAAITAA